VSTRPAKPRNTSSARADRSTRRLSIMARRIASGEAPADVPAPDLSVYDDFMKTGDGDTLKEREGGKDR
ncbi:transposase, partial [Bifidobacterium bifidum LMG 13195]|uniref:hypothetical protein n=1 Tax=Bifidobacterium bifidum TaxID=1681 RepID=UPI00065A2DA2